MSANNAVQKMLPGVGVLIGLTGLFFQLTDKNLISV